MMNSRKTFMKIALTLSEHSNCVGGQDGRIISSEVNIKQIDV